MKNMGFKEFKELMQSNFRKLAHDAKAVFVTDTDKEHLWNLYLDSFPEGTNEIYKERREYDCNCCKSFVRKMGNVVFVVNNKARTIWDFSGTKDTQFEPVIKALGEYVKSEPIANVFFSEKTYVGTDFNLALTESAGTITWHHFYIELPSKFVANGRSIGDIQSEHRASKEVFKRSLDELTVDSLETILELIFQNSLYKGQEWKSVLVKFLGLKKEYDTIDSEAQKDLYAWAKSVEVGGAIARIRNHSIGTLLVNISEGMELDLAVKKYEQIVAPSNYKRPKALYTRAMLNKAKAELEELGFMNSLRRRFAILDDITVNNVLFSNASVQKRIATDNIFDEMEANVPINPKKFSHVEEIPVEKFIANVLPNAREVKILLENKHKPNLISLTAPKDRNSKTMFKWNNAFGWAYSGNITDSSMKQAVAKAGGKVDGDLRFSIQWNDINRDTCDLDAHCIEPSGYEIYYMNKQRPSPTQGILDVDIINPQKGVVAVENITWATRNTMRNGTYKFFVHNYNGGNRHGFRAEIEFDGNIYSFNHDKQTRDGQRTQVAEVTLRNGEFSITEKMPSTSKTYSQEVWGLTTNQFIPVSIAMHSPNYWDEQSGVGHKHYFFMLNGCINPEEPNGFYNEFLIQELNPYRKFMEALGEKLAVESSDNQLSGIGFSSTKRNEAVFRVTGKTKRLLRVKF